MAHLPLPPLPRPLSSPSLSFLHLPPPCCEWAGVCLSYPIDLCFQTIIKTEVWHTRHWPGAGKWSVCVFMLGLPLTVPFSSLPFCPSAHSPFSPSTIPLLPFSPPSSSYLPPPLPSLLLFPPSTSSLPPPLPSLLLFPPSSSSLPPPLPSSPLLPPSFPPSTSSLPPLPSLHLFPASSSSLPPPLPSLHLFPPSSSLLPPSSSSLLPPLPCFLLFPPSSSLFPPSFPPSYFISSHYSPHGSVEYSPSMWNHDLWHLSLWT